MWCDAEGVVVDQFSSPEMSAMLGTLFPLTPASVGIAAATQAAAVPVAQPANGNWTWSTREGVVMSPFNTPQMNGLLAAFPPMTPHSGSVGLLTHAQLNSAAQRRSPTISPSLDGQRASPRQSGLGQRASPRHLGSNNSQGRVVMPSRLGKRRAADPGVQVQTPVFQI